MVEVHRTIHIVANCASRKRLPPVASLSSIHNTDLEKFSENWWKKLNNPPLQSSINQNLFNENTGKLRAKDLYVGNYWSKIRQLPNIVNKFTEYDSQLWVISAGYGLISADEFIYPYTATFTAGEENSVTQGESDRENRAKLLRKWWNLISNYSLTHSSNPRTLSELIKYYPNDYFLIVASADYISAIELDLIEGIQFLSSSENLLVITSKSFSNEKLSQYLIPSDARLQCNSSCTENCRNHLLGRGIRGSISSSLAQKIIENTRIWGLNATQIKEHIGQLVEQCPSIIQHKRTPLQDEDVSDFIKLELNGIPSASRSFLLRKLRDKGLACEQKRFKRLYEEISEEAK
jgi:hypothetical protein